MAVRQGFYFNKVTEEKLAKIINDFTSRGWEYVTLTKLGGGTLMEFDWPLGSEPVVPPGYESPKNSS